MFSENRRPSTGGFIFVQECMFGQCQPNVVDGPVSWREVPGGDRTGVGKACGGSAPAARGRKFSKIVLASAGEFPYSTFSHGGVAQLGERLTGSQEVRGSIPLVSTTVNVRPSGNRRPFSYAATT